MDTVRRRSGATVVTPTISEAFWGLVDANWSTNELAELVALCKAMENAYRRALRRD
jgi:ribonuclease HI